LHIHAFVHENDLTHNRPYMMMIIYAYNYVYLYTYKYLLRIIYICIIIYIYKYIFERIEISTKDSKSFNIRSLVYHSTPFGGVAMKPWQNSVPGQAAPAAEASFSPPVVQYHLPGPNPPEAGAKAPAPFGPAAPLPHRTRSGYPSSTPLRRPHTHKAPARVGPTPRDTATRGPGTAPGSKADRDEPCLSINGRSTPVK